LNLKNKNSIKIAYSCDTVVTEKVITFLRAKGLRNEHSYT